MKYLIPTLISLAGLAAAAADVAVSCPTITTTTGCTKCPVAQCIPELTVSVPCGCPKTVPTSTITRTCSGSAACAGIGCVSTYYSIKHASCTNQGTTSTVTVATPTPPVTASTSTSTGCPTITSRVNPSSCKPNTNCTEDDCVSAVSVTVPCSCVDDLPLKTTTITEQSCTCRTGCATTSVPVYIPCPVQTTHA